jgi:hypothetical protein
LRKRGFTAEKIWMELAVKITKERSREIKPALKVLKEFLK